MRTLRDVRPGLREFTYERHVTEMASSNGLPRPASTRVACVGALLLSACGEAEGPGEAPVAATLEEVFVVESVMQLGEDPADSIADIGDFVERRGGGYVIGDRFLPRVRSYDEEGRLETAFGRFGRRSFRVSEDRRTRGDAVREGRRCGLQPSPSDLSDQFPGSRYHGRVAGGSQGCPGART